MFVKQFDTISVKLWCVPVRHAKAAAVHMRKMHTSMDCRLNEEGTKRQPHPDSSSLSQEEVEKFSTISGKWWDVHGEFKPLHSMNDVRVPFIRDCLLYEGYGEGQPNTATPLRDIDILDVGCGGGILSEPLARLGANVVGIDTLEEAIAAAKKHRSVALDNLQYLCAIAEDIASVGSLKFDVVVASEVIEHVRNPSSFIHTCSSLLKPRGSIIVSSINRTLLSNALAVFAAERIFNVVPEDTHNWDKFVTPEELEQYLKDADCTVRKIHGLGYNPIKNHWSFIGSTDINYIVHATRDERSIDTP